MSEETVTVELTREDWRLVTSRLSDTVRKCAMDGGCPQCHEIRRIEDILYAAIYATQESR